MAAIRKRGNSYQIRVSCGTDVYGKKIINSMTWKPDEKMTPRQIEKELNKIAVTFEEQVKKGVVKTDNKIKLHAFCNTYLEMQKKKLSPVTYYQYEKTIRDYIIPTLGHLKLKDITPLHLQKFINALSEEGIRKDGKKEPLSPVSIRKYYALLQSILCFAHSMDIITSNPSAGKKLTFPKVIPQHIDILNQQQIETMLNFLEQEPIMWKTLIHLALCTGCRKGELAALQWNDISWEKQTISITKSIYQIKGEIDIKTPKTNSSIRTISIPTYMLSMLKQYKIYQSTQILSGANRNIYHMIFTNKTGKYLAPNIISRWFQNFLKRNQLPHIKFHALRHTSATLLLANGTNIKTVSHRLGHSNLLTTNRYVHALNDADTSAAALLENKLNFSKVGQELDKAF